MKLCTAARLAHTLTIRELAKLIENPVASMEAVPYRRLFYRQLERDKIKSLQQNKGNFKAPKKNSVGGKTTLWQPTKV